MEALKKALKDAMFAADASAADLLRVVASLMREEAESLNQCDDDDAPDLDLAKSLDSIASDVDHAASEVEEAYETMEAAYAE
jgi:hypothetical protein